jgi:hypothetical protein
MNTKEFDLLQYETPEFAEWINVGWIQTFIGRYIAYKVKKKLILYEMREERRKWLNTFK